MVYFISDAHLGSKVFKSPYENEKRLIALLNEMKKDATHIYLLGDIFDFWFEYYWRDESKRMYSALIKTLNHLVRRGIHVHFFIGNHDLWTFGGLHQMTGMKIHHKPYVTKINGKTIYMAHGDGLVPSDYEEKVSKEMQKRIRSFMRLRAFFHHPVPQFLYRLLPPKVGNYIGYEWSRRSRQKELDHPCPYKGEDKEELVLYSKELEATGPHHDFYIYGHRHIALDLQIKKDSRVVILGDFFKQWTYAKLDEKGNLELCTAEKNN